jgi:hypothetical protein
MTHQSVSFVKSVFRFLAALALISSGLSWAIVGGLFLAIAEILGIIEELV